MHIQKILDMRMENCQRLGVFRARICPGLSPGRKLTDPMWVGRCFNKDAKEIVLTPQNCRANVRPISRKKWA